MLEDRSNNCEEFSFLAYNGKEIHTKCLKDIFSQFTTIFDKKEKTQLIPLSENALKEVEMYILLNSHTL